MKDDSNDRAASRKQLAREIRRAAYQRAKAQRATDPRHLARKEAAKEQRRALYQEVKARRKATLAEQKTALKQAEREQKTEARAAKDGELMKSVRFLSKGSSADN